MKGLRGQRLKIGVGTESNSLLGQPKQLVDVTQADDEDIQSESIDGQLAKGSHLMIGISKEKSPKTHHQGDHQYIHDIYMQVVRYWIISEHTILLSLAMAS